MSSTTFNSYLVEAFSRISDQVDDWQFIATNVDHLIDGFEDEQSSITRTILDEIFEIDGNLAEVDHERVEQSVDTIENELENAGLLLIKYAVATELANGKTIKCGHDLQNIAQAFRSIPDFTPVKIEVDCDGSTDEIDDEYVDALVDARGRAADALRSVATELEEEWDRSVDAALVSNLPLLLLRLGALDVGLRRLRSAYDEWYLLLGGLSNVAPERLGGVDGATVQNFMAWYGRSDH